MVELILNFLTWLLVIVVCLFVFWRRMREEVDEERLWPVMVQMVVGGLITGRTAWWLWALQHADWQATWWWQIWRLPGVDMWGVVLGAVIVLWVYKDQTLKVVGEGGDALIEAVGWGLLLIVIGHWPLVIRWRYWVNLLIIVVFMWLWYWLKKHYRSFSWYPSGRRGFLWWVGVGFLAIGQLTVGQWPQPLLWRWGWVLYNGLLLVISMLGIYRLSGRSLGEDNFQAWKGWKTGLTTVRQRWRRVFK